jgi:hypothetical protein
VARSLEVFRSKVDADLSNVNAVVGSVRAAQLDFAAEHLAHEGGILLLLRRQLEFCHDELKGFEAKRASFERLGGGVLDSLKATRLQILGEGEEGDV